MLHMIYRAALQLPEIPGKGRLTKALRSQLALPVTDVHGLRMQLDPLEWAQIDILSHGGIEPQTLALFAKVLRPGDSYIDVGAHVGYHTLMARQQVGADGRVLAIEPQPYNANKILVNVSLNRFSNVTVVVAAAGDADGAVRLHDQIATDKSRLTLSGNGVSDDIAVFEVPRWSLDTLVARHEFGPIRLLKIDVEGYELSVLRGALKSLPSVDNVICEILPGMPSGQLAAIRDLLVSQGFSLLSVEGSSWLDGDELPENNLWARRI
jgi:FkbM family methyltransferase